MRKESEFMLCRTVGSSIFAMATVSEAVTSESRKELVTEELSEPFRCISAPTVRREGISAAECVSVTQALSVSPTRISKSKVRKNRCHPVRVLFGQRFGGKQKSKFLMILSVCL
jgi:hypothetical protein